ncbi:MAG: AAA family ATPase [Candidatus Scalindua sp.]|nr:AAA family ATPase [Candidatus Scalindua sp.]
MYMNFYGLEENPFNLTPDPAYLYLSKSHKKAMAYLTYGLEGRKGIIQLTGEIGSGKTTILKSILEKKKNNLKAAFIVNPKATFEQLLRMILTQFSIIDPETHDSKDVLMNKFQNFLKDQAKQKTPVVIIFDEAQNIEIPVLEEIRMLSNLETEKDKLVQIVFVGQPELRETFSLHKFKQLKQRIAVACHLNPLSQEESEEYIEHRLKVASTNGLPVFTKEACQEIYAYSNGIPRLINIVCDEALLAGYVEGKKTLDENIVKEAISGLINDSM